MFQLNKYKLLWLAAVMQEVKKSDILDEWLRFIDNKSVCGVSKLPGGWDIG